MHTFKWLPKSNRYKETFLQSTDVHVEFRQFEDPDELVWCLKWNTFLVSSEKHFEFAQRN